MSIDMSQFYQVFFEETSEHLASMETLLLDLDLAQPALEDLNAIFRAAHSIKGGSGTFGFTDMTEVTHVLETLLDRLRKQELALRPEMVDAFLAAGDVLRAQLGHHQGGTAVDAGEVAAVRERLRQLADAGDAGRAATVAAAPADGEARRLRLTCALPAKVAAVPESVENLLQGLADFAALDIRHRPDAGDCTLDLLLTTRRGDDELREALAFYLAPEEIALRSEVDASDGQEQPPATEDFGLFDDAPGHPDAPELPAVAPGDSPAALEGPGYGIFVDAPGGVGLFDDAPGCRYMVENSAPAPIGRPRGGGESPAAAPAPGRRLADNPSVETVKVGRRDADKIASANADSSVRVSVERMDQLINLVGELVITQAMLAEAVGELEPARAERLLAGIELLARNTRDMQEAVMSIRMLPMSMVFSRFPRVVRDLAGKLGKQVEMRTVGESTELDKGLIERIADPLTHLVRNSLDHGIETPERRVAAGKAPKGTLTLKAAHQGGNVVIEVIDDGAGLNRARILEKASEHGLAASEAMSDHEVWQLIFAPGFSTADTVTDVSGRGVGMDVVKRNIESLGGRVELESSPGWGTRTVIRLPLTLAILDGMSVGVGGETFIVPITSVVESLQPEPVDLRTLAGDARVVRIRGDYLPLISLAEIFDLRAGKDATTGIVVVVEADEGRAALLVDELLGQHQVVIKSLEDNYRKVPGISGATIMGDGRVALILDVTGIARMARARGRARLAA